MINLINERINFIEKTHNREREKKSSINKNIAIIYELRSLSLLLLSSNITKIIRTTTKGKRNERKREREKYIKIKYHNNRYCNFFDKSLYLLLLN